MMEPGQQRDLTWLKEPEEREVDFGSDEDFLPHGQQQRPHGASAESESSNPSARIGKDSEVGSTMVGKASDIGDLELQPLTAAGGGAAVAAGAAAKEAAERPKKPLYSVWPSRNKFFCQGALMTGGETEMGITPNCSVPNLCVWTCILAPCSLYFLWVFPHLWRQGVYAMPFATLAVFLMTSGFLLATCCSDPGIIPRREVIIATGAASRLEAALGYDALAAGHVPPDGRNGSRHIPPDLSKRGYRWCRTCRIVRPPRASHCPDCDNCVLRYDHHCPFVNNCVGQRNYHFFFGFVTSVLCLALLVLPVLFWFLNSEVELAVDGLMHVSRGVLQPLFFTLIGAGSLIGVAATLSGVLWVYHVFLIATNRTTKEFRRNIPNMDEEPTLCATRGPRLFDPWALVDPRDLIRQDEAPPPTPSNFCSACWDDDW